MHNSPWFISEFFIIVLICLWMNSGNSVPLWRTFAHKPTWRQMSFWRRSRFLLTVQTQVPIFRWKRRAPCVRSFKYQTRLCWVHLGRTCGHSGNYQRLSEHYMSPLTPPQHTHKNLLSCFSTLSTQTTPAAEDHNRLKFWTLERARPGSAARKQSVLPYCCSTWRQALLLALHRNKNSGQTPFLFPSPRVMYFPWEAVRLPLLCLHPPEYLCRQQQGSAGILQEQAPKYANELSA